MSSASDVESLVSTLRHRNRCVYVCLSCLTVALVAVSVSGAAVFALFWGDLQKQIASLKQEQTMTSSLTSAPEANSFKSGHLAYLRAKEAIINTHTLIWEAIDYGSGSSVGTNFDYDQLKGALTVKSAGSYFVYANLHFTPTATDCSSNRVKVTLMSKGQALFSCAVDLPACEDGAPAPAVAKKCWDVVQHVQENTLVTTDMHVAKDTVRGWKLDATDNKTGLGMFLVDSS